MTRIKLKNTIGDGGAFDPHNRPPLNLLPGRFPELFAELDRMKSQTGKYRAELSTLDTEWSIHTEDARKADGKATAEQGRLGNAVIVTTSADALAERRRDLEAKIATSAAAEQLIAGDLQPERESEQKKIDTYRQAESKARAALVKTLAQLTKDAEALTRAIALREWISDHTSWEPTVQLNAADIWEPAARENGTTRIPVRLDAVTNALANL